jgi:hypothetical protein
MSESPLPKTDDTPLSTVLAVIESVMKRAEDITKQTAEQHMQAFTRQMQEKVGVASVSLNEPYLPLLLKEGEVRFLTKLERFFYQMDSSEPPEPETATTSKWLLPRRLEYKAINLKNPLLPQVEDRLGIETIRYQLGLKQELDARRQQAFGISQYIWRTRGDDKVRPGHAAYDGQLRKWGEGEAPGDGYNCRCWAEPVPEGDGMPKVEVAVLDKLAAFGLLAARILRNAEARKIARATAERLFRSPVARDIFKRPKNVPKEWKKLPSNKGEGTRYRDPKNIHNEVRVQKGKPDVSNPLQQKDYVRWKKDGKWLDKNGKISTDPEKTHIPPDEFRFLPELFK